MSRPRFTKLAIAGTLALALAGAAGAAGVAFAGTDQTGPQPGAAIVGGHDPSQQYNGMASLQLTHPRTGERDFHTCGAKLYSGYWVYTNAHCVTLDDGTPYPGSWELHVRVGSHDRTAAGVLANVKTIVAHEQWAWGAIPGQPVADIAMLRLDRYVDLAPFGITPVRPSVGQKVRLIGWGITEPDLSGPPPTTLRELDVHRLPHSKCASGGITAGEICISSPRLTGACYGDSGGPGLVKGIDGRWWDAGGLSRGTAADGACATAPDIMTDSTYYRQWMFYVATHGTTPTPPIDRPAGNLRLNSGLAWNTALTG